MTKHDKAKFEEFLDANARQHEQIRKAIEHLPQIPGTMFQHVRQGNIALTKALEVLND